MSKLREENYFSPVQPRKKHCSVTLSKASFQAGLLSMMPSCSAGGDGARRTGWPWLPGSGTGQCAAGCHRHLVDCKAGLLTVSDTPFRRDICMGSSM